MPALCAVLNNSFKVSSLDSNSRLLSVPTTNGFELADFVDLLDTAVSCRKYEDKIALTFHF